MVYRCVWCKREVFRQGMQEYVAWLICNLCLPNFKIVVDGQRRSLEKMERTVVRQPREEVTQPSRS